MGAEKNGGEISFENIRNPNVAYERTDVSARAVIWFLVGLTISGVLIHLLLGGMYRYFSVREGRLEQAPTPYLRGERPATPEPRLQRDPVADWQGVHLSEQQKLNSYGWVDEQRGVARIPIDRAMDLLVERGLPVQPRPSGRPAVKAAEALSTAGPMSDAGAETGQPMSAIPTGRPRQTRAQEAEPAGQRPKQK